MKQRWQEEACVNCLYRNDRTGIAWWRIGIWKMRGIRKEFKKGSCPLCYEQEDDKHVLPTCPDTMTWREEFLCKKSLGLNQILP
jgi:hypothetical protein